MSRGVVLVFGGVGSGPSVTSGLVGWNRLLALPALLFLAVLLAVWSPLAWLGLARSPSHRAGALEALCVLAGFWFGCFGMARAGGTGAASAVLLSC